MERFESFMGVLSLDGILLGVNHSLEHIGKPFVETPWWAYSLVAQEQVRQTMQQAVQGKSSHCKIQAQLNQNHYALVDLTISPIFDGQGQIHHLAVSAAEIVEHHQHTAQLLETILNHTHILVACMDAEFNFIQVNRAYAEADQQDISFFPGKNHFDLYPNAENESIFRQVVETGMPYFVYAKPFEYAEHAERGTTYWDWSLIPIKNAQGKTVSLVLSLADVTQRIKADEDLRQAHAQVSSILSSISDGFFVINDDFVVTYFNHAAERLLGRRCEDVVGQHLFDAFPEARGSIFEEKYSRALREHEPTEFETYFAVAPYANWYTVRVYPQENGLSVYFQVSTERKRTEDQLHYQATLLESVSDAIFSTDANQIFQSWNRAAETIYGWGAEEVLGKAAYPILQTEIPGQRQEDLLRQLFEQGFWRGEVIQCRKDGTPIDILAATTVLRDEQGNVSGIVTVNRDITDRKQTEQALRDSELRFRQLADSMPQLVWTAKPDGTVDYYNERYHEFQGITSDDTGHWHWEPVVHPEDLQATVQAWQHAVETGNAYQAEHRILLSNGSFRWFLSRGVPVRDAAGQIIRWFGTATDIHEQKLAHEEIQRLNETLEQRVLERTAQLTAVNKELEAFSYSVSHDLRAPLRAINGFSQALIEDYGSVLDEQAHFYLQRIRGASLRMGELIDELLKLSRLTRGEMQQQQVNLSAIAREIASELQETDPKRQVEWNIQDGLMAYGDAHLLRAVIENLLGNAWKFSSTKAGAQIEFGKTYDRGQPVYFVRDNGVGFDMTYANKLFRAFQRLHSPGEFEGSGIGLATVQRIIHRHGGRVWAEGVVGQGATFYFTL